MIISAREHIPGGTESGLSVFFTALFYRSTQFFFRHMPRALFDIVE
jgi:hypothetical protein